jgi:hypothetical protein
MKTKIRGISKYPVGATWEAVGSRGNHGRIWLESRSDCMEVWRWSVYYKSSPDKSHGDWNPSYELCRKEIPIWGTREKPLRFKRIK